MQHPELPIFAFLSAVLVLIPLAWHWRARNVATLAIIFWLFLANIIYGINAIIWAGNVEDPVPVWCDITTKFLVGASYALPLATMCICKHLELVSSSRQVSYDAQHRQRRMIFEGVMCFLVPMIFMGLHYIIQGHRYDIFEDVGCQAAVYISIQAVFIIWFPQLLFSFIAFIYATLALHHFIRRRLIFAAHLQNSNSALTTNRYLRLMAMAVTEMTWSTTLTAYNLWNNVSPGLRPWTNWADVHSNFSRVDTYPVDESPPEFLRAMMLFWWTLPASSLIFFAFFGFGEEAKKEYNKIWNFFKAKVLRRKADSKKAPLGGSYPISRVPRPLKLSNLDSTTSASSTGSPSRDFHAKSPSSALSHSSRSTITLAPYSPNDYTHKKNKSDEAKEDGLPSYYAPYSASSSSPTSAYPQIAIGAPIDANRNTRLSLPEIDNSDTFTISTFSYYENSVPYTPPATSTSTTTLVPPKSPPHPPPSPRLTLPQHTLPPPPRRAPRGAGSSSSLLSNFTGSRAPTPMPELLSSSMQDVPEDVGPASYTQQEGVLSSLPERERVHLAGPGLSQSSFDGGIMVTVQTRAAFDEV